MPQLQTANILVGLGGDVGNTVPKYGVTAAEVAVLRAIHGVEAVFDIEILGQIERKHRDERARLLSIYGKMIDGKDVSPIADLFPGAAARVFETFEELEIPEDFYKNQSEPATKAKPLTAKQRAALEAKAQEAADADNDGIGDMPGAGGVLG